MKVTSEQLLDLFGLKVGDRILYNGFDYTIIENKQDSMMLKLTNDYSLSSIMNLLNQDYEIIKHKPQLTEDEKVILRNLPEEYKWIVREKDDRLWVHNEIPTRSLEPCGWVRRSVNSLAINLVAFNHLFQFITWEDEPYLIEDLLK